MGGKGHFQKSLNENLDARGGLSSGELLARKVAEVPQTVKAIATAVGYMPD